MFNDLGDTAEQRSLLERALRGREKVLGSEHPDTLFSMKELAVLLLNLGDAVEARRLFERELRGWEKVMGPEHSNTLRALCNVAVSLDELGEKARLSLEGPLRPFQDLLVIIERGQPFIVGGVVLFQPGRLNTRNHERL